MTNLFDAIVVTPEETIFHGKLRYLIAPGQEGYFEVMARHAPMVAMLRPGKLTLMDDSEQKHEFAITGGYVEVSRAEVEVLIDSLQEAHEAHNEERL
jgi:F-type H+-transporting ATPase subunit epsilon